MSCACHLNKFNACHLMEGSQDHWKVLNLFIINSVRHYCLLYFRIAGDYKVIIKTLVINKIMDKYEKKNYRINLRKITIMED